MFMSNRNRNKGNSCPTRYRLQDRKVRRERKTDVKEQERVREDQMRLFLLLFPYKGMR